jgi:peptide/nickel transport system permease protein
MRYLSRRLAHGLLVLAGISVLSFVFTGFAPGDFLSDVRLDPRLSRETVVALRARYGLDQPLPLKYLHWLQSVSRGELGFSMAYNRPVGSLLWPRAKHADPHGPGDHHRLADRRAPRGLERQPARALSTVCARW